MTNSFIPLVDQIYHDSPLIKRSFEALTDDLLFLFERLNVRVSLVAVYIENVNHSIPKGLLRKTCAALPLSFTEYFVPQNTGWDEIIALVKSLNVDKDIHGLIADLPFSPDSILIFIDPLKNVRLNNSDYLQLKELGLPPNEEEILSILMMLEKTFDAAVEQISKQRGNPG